MIHEKYPEVPNHVSIHSSKMNTGRDEHGKCRYLALRRADYRATFCQEGETLICKSKGAPCVFATGEKNMSSNTEKRKSQI